MESAVLRKDVLTETYFDVQGLIFEAVWRFKGRYGGDFEELLAEANFLYILALDSYCDSRGALSTWLFLRIGKGLLSALRRSNQESKHGVTFCDLLENENVASLSHINSFHLFELLEELSQDSRTIVELVFYPPEELTREELEKGLSVCKCRRHLKAHLRRLGWTGRRIRESFAEIREIICE